MIKPYDGLMSHREALEVVFDELEKRDLEDQRKAREMLGDRIADQIPPWIYDIDKAQSKHLDPQEFFYCPNIVKTDYYGGACCWSIYDKAMKRYVVMLVSATD